MTKMAALALLVFAALSLAGCGRGMPAPVLNLGTQLDAPAGATMVSDGDTLWDISRRYDLPMRDIIDVNRLSPPYRLLVGQRLKLPAPQEYTIQSQDTLYAVSRTFGVDVSELVRVNRMSPPYALRVGQVLRVPSGHARRFSSILADAVGAGRDPARRIDMPSGYAPPRTRRQDWGDRLEWPVSGRVISGFGPKSGGLHNDGINIAAPRGAPVLSADAGTVVYAGNDLEGYGNLVLVRHTDGMVTAYAHLADIHVIKGTAVMRGQAIGTVGSTGAVDSPQVHFEVRRGSSALDPEQYLDSRV